MYLSISSFLYIDLSLSHVFLECELSFYIFLLPTFSALQALLFKLSSFFTNVLLLFYSFILVLLT